ncbi:hypothetical protein INT48_006911 [Thamnidium elegans]|uniref:ORC6 second cyclin-like domain-containing protein n=1 Tax=Thamnidium elegans TaxID=101142 RepID=A0A8H7VXE8_9FUNG|nr:hypothetical protein INT48_006911 [Thamnidium elegans]
MANPITHCLERLNLADNVKVKQRAEQFQGQLSGIPSKIFDKGPNLKSVVCIQLAYESLKNYDWDIKLGAQLAGCSLSAYESALSIVRQQLNLQSKVTLDMLAVALGSTTMLTHVNALWQDFTTSYLNKLTGAKKTNGQKELEDSCWKGAVMYICAKAFGKNLDKDKLHSLCGCTTSELTKSIKVIRATSSKKIAALKNESTSAGRSSRRKRRDSVPVQEEKENKEEGNQKEGDIKKVKKVKTTPKTIKPISGIVSMINHQDYLRTKRYADYQKWRSNLIHHLTTTI